MSYIAKYIFQNLNERKIDLCSEEKEKLSDDGEGGSEPPALSEEFPSQPSTPMTMADDAARAATLVAAASTLTPTAAATTPTPMEEETSKAPWPSVGDLNNRLRRVITSYQRNFKKEELKMAQKAKVTIHIIFYLILEGKM